MHKTTANPALYAAAQGFVDRALLTDDSIFTPGASVWTAEQLDDLHDRYVGQVDEGDRSFEDKLQDQLDGADDRTIQLAAELLFVHLLAPSDIGSDRKVEKVVGTLSWMADPVEIPEGLSPGLDGGISNFGVAHTNRYYLVRVVLDVARAFKDRGAEERREIVADPWRFKLFVLDLDLTSARAQAEALLHLVHPDVFEPIISKDAKENIVDAWEDLVDDPIDDVDRRILQIRSALERRYGEGFDFYEPRIRGIWDGDDEPWDKFVSWARKFFEDDRFDELEREVKLHIAEDVRAIQDQIRDGDGEDWVANLRRALDNNLVTWRPQQRFTKWCQTNRDRAAQALHDLWEGDGPLEERVDRFIEGAEEPLYGAKVRLTSVLLMALDPTEFAPYAKRAYEKAFDLCGHPHPRDAASDGERYRHALAFLDRIMEESAKRGLQLRDRLDAQSVLYWTMKAGRDAPIIEDWDEEAWRRLQAYRGDEVDLENGHGTENGRRDPLTILADELMLARGFLARIRRLLEQKGQVIFYGPPGTGKTYVAQKLAETLAPDGAGHLVQFHPSYAYEDFVEGYRPSDDGGPSGFQLVEGPLKRIAARAAERPTDPHVLVIDEINRGNVAKVFGELYFLLEYRDQEIALQYSDDGFRLPDNLWIIGTMNTADRSIALMDAALRRRFYFVPFFPDQKPIRGLLGRWLDRHAPDLRWVADVVREANRRLDDPHFAIGPSHFMREDLTEEWVATVWEHSILPYLEERFFGDTEALGRFALAELRAVVEGTAEADTPEAVGADGVDGDG